MRRASLLALIVVAAACGGDDAAESTGSVPGTGGETVPTPSPTPPGDAVAARLVAVLDGDSLEVDLDGSLEEVRLEGINAPERDECWSAEARTAASGLVDGAGLLVAASERDRYGRLLGFVWADGSLVNLRLVEAGAALALSGDHTHVDVFLAAEAGAVAAGTGWWARDACGPAPDAAVTVARITPDAPGRDDENPNGEWVEIVNEGDAADLSGWVLRDESSVHRFVFPEGFTLGPGAGVIVRSGWGDDDGATLYWGAGSVWNNDGDTVLLLDGSGNVVERRRY